MNVLFLTHSFPRSEGDAAGSFILRLAVALRGENVNVRVVAPAGPGLPASAEIEGVRLVRKVGIAKPLFVHVLKHSAAVTTVSHWLKDETEALAPGVQPTVAPMPVATDLFAPGSSRDGQRLLFVGRLTEQKGVDHLL